MVEAFTERRQVMLEYLNSIPGFTCIVPTGAFYMYPNISKLGINSLDFCSGLLETQQVAAVPGVAFGTDDCIRLSYATSIENIRQGMDRLAAYVAAIG
jgi:aspartate aminotransferase